MHAAQCPARNEAQMTHYVILKTCIWVVLKTSAVMQMISPRTWLSVLPSMTSSHANSGCITIKMCQAIALECKERSCLRLASYKCSKVVTRQHSIRLSITPNPSSLGPKSRDSVQSEGLRVMTGRKCIMPGNGVSR